MQPSSTSSTKPKSKTAAIVGAVGGVAALVILALVIALVWTCRRHGRRKVNQPVDVVNSPMGQSMTNSQAPIMSSAPSESSDLYLLEVSHLLAGSHVPSPPWNPCTCELAITTRPHSMLMRF
jgi:hypothetical protein